MTFIPSAVGNSCVAAKLFSALMIVAALASVVATHPLGNFTINHFTRLGVGADRVAIRYVVEMAEISTHQELQTLTANRAGGPNAAELEEYARGAAAKYLNGLALTIDGTPVDLRLVGQRASLKPGDGGLLTLRVECDLESSILAGNSAQAHRLHFEDRNHEGRAGWHEIVVTPESGTSVFDSDSFASGLTDELHAYPADLLAAPLDERSADLSFVQGAAPADAHPLRMRNGSVAVKTQDRFAALISVPTLTPSLVFLGLMLAFVFGGMHALSPGHGKTVVGAYLVGARGTAKHAAFLGLTVTITHTLGVFALGLVTLFASRYVVPERLFPIISFASGAIVLGIGLSLFVRRLRGLLGGANSHTHDHTHDSSHIHDGNSHAHDGHTHSHGGREHSHLPPGVDGGAVTWRSLLALGISGGLLPCPSALVVMLSAISLHRVGYGLVLIVAFSLGLASVLTAIGLAFIYARRFIKLPDGAGGLVRALPIASAFVIAAAGAAICYGALKQAGVDLVAIWTQTQGPGASVSAASILGLGLILGLKHALEADHMAAVATIVSERRSIFGSSLVGALWGVGHTISLLIAGIVVILLRLEIKPRVAMALEFGVALMLVWLGANVIYKLMRGGKVHLHAHAHGGHRHFHPHLHDESSEPQAETHHGFRLGMRPLIVGMIHGLAGSAALMLLVLSTIPSPALGFVYILIFGLGSIGGMMLMSALVGLPVHFTALRFERANVAVRALAGTFSLGFGVFMVYEIGFVEGLLR